uniref:Uncharacterized protein n=1 Tax=Oryza brachyantha TaxID=4533 RepID=J3MQX2_ORYBR
LSSPFFITVPTCAKLSRGSKYISCHHLNSIVRGVCNSITVSSRSIGTVLAPALLPACIHSLFFDARSSFWFPRDLDLSCLFRFFAFCRRQRRGDDLTTTRTGDARRSRRRRLCSLRRRRRRRRHRAGGSSTRPSVRHPCLVRRVSWLHGSPNPCRPASMSSGAAATVTSPYYR